MLGIMDVVCFSVRHSCFSCNGIPAACGLMHAPSAWFTVGNNVLFVAHLWSKPLLSTYDHPYFVCQ